MLALSMFGLLAVVACTPNQLQADLPVPHTDESSEERIMLPQPIQMGQMSLEQALLERRSVREYQDQRLRLDDLSQLLWAAQGVTHAEGLRTAPSAGALYPLELHVVVGDVENLIPGIYQYSPLNHALRPIATGDKRAALSRAALGQETIEDAPVVIAISAVYERTTTKYGGRGIRYTHMEVGAAAQNVYLQATALALGTVFIGAFHDEEVKELLILDQGEAPMCLMPVGRPYARRR
jgi:SagB-type dehydrogenase family enzyme